MTRKLAPPLAPPSQGGEPETAPADSSPALPTPPLRRVLLFVAAATAFALAYTQAPLFFSNQNQYFLHGLAHANAGLLANDWLAGTTDPTPIFSKVVELTWHYLPALLFHLYYAVILGLYLWAMTGIFAAVAGPRASVPTVLLFIALVTLTHSALVRWLSWRLLGNDYPWFLQSGVAGQYLLGPVLQPSTFGVLLLISVAGFVNGRPLWAAFCASATVVLHATYMPSAALLIFSYIVICCWERHWREAVRVGILALIVAMPAVLYNLVVFGPTSMETFTRAQHILAHVRVPHHAEPKLWLDAIAFAQIAWIGLAIAWARRGRLFLVLTTVSILTLVLVVAQVVSASDSLALLFPWRTTAYLVPAATAVILSKVVCAFATAFDTPGRRRSVVAASAGLLVALASGGVWLMISAAGYLALPTELPVLDHVRDEKRQGDLYLLPVKLPVAPETASSPNSVDFRPASPIDGTRPVAFDLQGFRLYTGAPIFADFKSIPYRDVELLEWYARLLWTRDFYSHLDQETLGDLDNGLQIRGITHVVVRADTKVRCRELTPVFEGGAYRLYRVNRNRE